MKITEIITEAHHHRMGSSQIGQWMVHIDTHAFVTLSSRNVSVGDAMNILNFACKYVPELKTIPRGKGAYFQDTNSLISLYLKRSKDYPMDITLETVLDSSMKPTPPLFRRPVPPTPEDMQDTPNMKAGAELMRQQVQAKGRDAVSQDIEGMMPAMNAYRAGQEHKPDPDYVVEPQNREQRRAFDKYLRKKRMG
jgi:hypothetical protein